MQKLWNFISGLGISENNRHLDQRSTVLSNQLNFVMFLTMFILLITTVMTLFLTNDTVSFGTLRVVTLMLLSFINLAAARAGYHHFSKLSLIFLPPVFFLLGPTLIGYVEEESYTYYPYLIVGTSIIPQLLLNPKKDRYLYVISLAYYFLLVIFIDTIMIMFDQNNFQIVERIKTFYPFYKIAQIGLFFFISAGIYYLRRLNFIFEDELKRKNYALGVQNTELKFQKDLIEKHKDELLITEVSTWQNLVNIISHEIINSAIPVTNLAGLSAQMIENEDGEVLEPRLIDKEAVVDIHHGLRIIESRTTALVNFVNATKNLSKIPQPVIRDVPVDDLFKRVSILFQGRFNKSGVKLKTEINPAGLTLKADLELIEQVIINLFQNALEAMKDTAEPELSVSGIINNTGQKEISVKDNGTGIKNELLQKIFLPYFSTKSNKSGIGLSLSKQIMVLHHGRIEALSDGKGSTFRLIF